jgi:hypothetical protein
MIWRVIMFWLLGVNLVWADLPRPSSASALPTTVTRPNSATITNGYDGLARLTNTALLDYWGHVLDGYGYLLDGWGLRTNLTRQLGLTTNMVAVTNDGIGQLIGWGGSELGGAARANEQLAYGYDAAGNLHFRTNGALQQTFTVDTLNQLSSVSRAGTFTETGATPAPATSVTVNGNTATTYGDFTFADAGITLANGNNTFTTIAESTYGAKTTNVLSLNLPASVNFQYDANGNLRHTLTEIGRKVKTLAILSRILRAAFAPLNQTRIPNGTCPFI